MTYNCNLIVSIEIPFLKSRYTLWKQRGDISSRAARPTIREYCVSNTRVSRYDNASLAFYRARGTGRDVTSLLPSPVTVMYDMQTLNWGYIYARISKYNSNTIRFIVKFWLGSIAERYTRDGKL